MTALKVEMFGGMAPAVESKYLPSSQADYAVNTWLDLGALTGFYKLHQVATSSAPQIGKAYRLPADYDSPSNFNESTYMFFENPDTDVVRGAVFGDTHDRYYWASTSGPPRYNTRARIAANSPSWLLGIPSAPTPMSLATSGGVAPTTVTRAYVITYVSAYGEEGAPNPPVTRTAKPDGLWDLSDIPVPDVADQGVNRNITAKRLYRTVTGSSGVATFFMVDELAPSVTTYSDILTDADITGNQQLQSTSWTGPPVDLRGFCMGANGMLAGWRENEVWISEPYRPHAWPVSYVLTVEYPIVGLASIGNYFYVLTRGYPVVISGTMPANLLPLRVTAFEPCTSRGGIVVFPEGVYYPSGNGLILMAPGSATAINITKTFISKERWQTYVQKAQFRAGRLGSAYYGYGSIQQGIFQPDAFENTAFAMEDYSGAYNGIYIDATNQRISLVLLQSDIPVNNVHNDAWSSELLVLKENKVYWVDVSDATQDIEPAIWHSKEFQLPFKQCLGAAMIFFDVPQSTPAQNPVRDTDQNQVLKPDQYGIITWYGDNRQLAKHEIRTSGELLRLPSDTKYDDFRFEIETRVNVTAVHVASVAKELRTVV